MKLSNKKIKYIKRNAPTKTPEDIASDLGISIKEVRHVLRGPADRSPKGEKQVIKGLDSTLRAGLAILTFLAPFMFLRGIYDYASLPKMFLIQVGVLLLFLIWLVRSLVNGKFLILKSPANLPILLFLLWSLISLTYAHNPYEGFLTWMHWAASVIMFFVVSNGVREEHHRLRLVAAVFLSGVLCSILGIAQYLFEIAWVPQSVSPAATFANKNMAVHFIILTLPLAFCFFLNSKNRILDWVLCTGAGLMVVFLIYSRTRAGWLALAAEVLFLSGLLVRERIKYGTGPYWSANRAVAAGFGLLLIVVMINLGPEGFKPGFGEAIDHASSITSYEDTSEEEESSYSSGALRLAIWRNTLEMIKDNFWVGLGLGNHQVFYPLYHRKAVEEKVFSENIQLRYVHNDFLQAFSELGIVGMILLAWLGFSWVKVALKLTASSHSRRIRLGGIGITVAIMGLLVNACFSFPLERAIPPFVLMTFMGLLFSSYEGENRRCYEIKSRPVMVASMAIVAIGLLWVVRFHNLGIKCDRHYLNIIRLEKSKNWEGVIAETRRAVAYNPHRVKALSPAGGAYLKTGKPRKAIKVLGKVIAAYPNDLNAHMNMGVAYGSIGEYASALDAYEKVLNISPLSSKAHNNRGTIYMKQGKMNKALEEFNSSIQLDPKNSSPHSNIGKIAMHDGHYPEAARAFERAVLLNPGSDVAQKNLGYVYFRFLNRKKEGLDHFRKALLINPRIEDAGKIRNLLKSMEKSGQGG